jgi:hypothetical protein
MIQSGQPTGPYAACHSQTFHFAPQPNWSFKRTRTLPDFCGHSDLTENSSHGNPWTTKDQTL